MARRKPDRFDRAMKALARVGRTKKGREFLKELGRDHGDAVLHALGEAIGKP